MQFKEAALFSDFSPLCAFLGHGIPNIGGSLMDTMVLTPGQFILAFFIGAGFFSIAFIIFSCEFLNYHVKKVFSEKKNQFELFKARN